MSEHLTIEEVKAELTKYYLYTNTYIINLLDRLEPSDAKLRKVREEIKECCVANGFSHRLSLEFLYIIDAHLTPEKPSELEKLKQENEELRSKINNAVKELGR